jgi:hypothetical protein
MADSDTHSPESEFPPVVYVPCTKDPTTGELRVALRDTKDGRVALLVYTALDRLQALAGEDTPWVLLSVAGLQDVYRISPYDVVYPDLMIPESRR